MARMSVLGNATRGALRPVDRASVAAVLVRRQPGSAASAT